MHQCHLGLLSPHERNSTQHEDRPQERSNPHRERGKQLHRSLDQYLDADAPAKLTNKAVQRLNEYAYGGYLVLNEKFSNKPADQTTFLQQYDQLVVELAAKNPVWA